MDENTIIKIIEDTINCARKTEGTDFSIFQLGVADGLCYWLEEYNYPLANRYRNEIDRLYDMTVEKGYKTQW